MLGKFIIGGVMTAAIVASYSQIRFPPKPRLLYNPSPSAAIGWYQLTPKTPIRLDGQVAAYAPDWARRLADERGYLPYDYPLIKTVWAGAGDEICFGGHVVSAPGRPDIPRLARDGLGRDMPQPTGCITLQPGEIFLISPDVQTGFDSRYFGPVGPDNILGGVKYLGSGKNKTRIGLEAFEGAGR